VDGNRHLLQSNLHSTGGDYSLNSRRKILVLLGPTASGKTTLSIALAQLLSGEIISADSRQVYRYLDVGTAKPKPDQRALVRHYFVDELDPNEVFNAGEFGTRGREVIENMLVRDKVPIVVGGSGLYIYSLIDGLFEGPGADREFRESMEERIKAYGVQPLLEELRKVDPAAAERADLTKPRRIIRALEVYHLTGTPITEHHRAQKVHIHFVPEIFGLDWERKQLYERIERRCEEMLADGLLDEAEQLETMGYDSSLNALNTVGYAEASAYRRGKISYTEFVRLFKQNTRRYAKRQLTWFRRDSRITWLHLDENTGFDEVASTIVHRFQHSQRRGPKEYSQKDAKLPIK
jgi:tRNA dimethylallyltransferase